MALSNRSDRQAVCPQESRSDHESALRADDGLPGSAGTGGVAKDLLSMGAPWPGRPSGWSIGQGSRSTGEDSLGRVAIGKTAGRHASGKRAAETEANFERSGLEHRGSTRDGSGEKKMSG